MVQAVMQAMRSDGERQISFAHSLAAHLLLCGPVPNRQRTTTSWWPGDWGPLL